MHVSEHTDICSSKLTVSDCNSEMTIQRTGSERKVVCVKWVVAVMTIDILSNSITRLPGAALTKPVPCEQLHGITCATSQYLLLDD